MPGDSRNEEPGAVGYVGLAVIVAMICGGIYGIYSHYFWTPPAVVSLSAYFVDDSGKPALEAGHLKLKGEVNQAAQPVKSGSVHLIVATQDRKFQQSISLDLKNGQFETDDPAFWVLGPADRIHIKAEVSAPEISESASQDLYVNTTPPTLTARGGIVLWGIVFFFIAVFFISFTGRKTPGKNRAAIVFSYCVIGLFLAVPLLAPVLLMDAFPNALDSMVGAPVGLVITHISNQEDDESQWALNIGGYSFKVQSTAPSSGNSTSNRASSPGANQGTEIPIAPTSAAQQTDRGPQTVTQDRSITSLGGTVGAVGQEMAVDLRFKGADRSNQSRGSINQLGNLVRVQGGLVIPLYVIVLSVIGGAINMTRKVPRFQREGEFSELSLPRPVGQLETRVMSAVSNLKRSNVQNEKQDDAVGVPGIVRTGNQETPPDAAKGSAIPKEAELAREPMKSDIPEQETQAQQNSRTAITQATELTVRASERLSTTVSKNEKAKSIDAQLDQLVRMQVERNSDADSALVQIRNLVQQMRDTFDAKTADESILGFESFDDWLGTRSSLRELLGSNWRVELLNQYMYLISAPFLAIVAYYALDLLGLTKQPILVIVSFSVGLVSERILSWILGIASGYLRDEKSSQPAVR